MREIAFIDPSVSDIDTLIAGLRAEVEPVVLRAARPPLSQMLEVVEAGRKPASVHVIAHGAPGQVLFSHGSLTEADVSIEHEVLGRLGQATDELLLWTCDTGAGDAGRSFVEALAAASGARVKAASHRVGAAVLGGAWRLDAPARRPLTDAGEAAYSGMLTLSVDSASLTGITSDNGTSASDYITNDATLIFRGMILTSHGGGQGNLGVWLSGGAFGTDNNGKGTLVGAAVVTGNGAWSLDLSSQTLADGVYTIHISDGKGKGSADLATHTLTIDTSADTGTAATLGVTIGDGLINNLEKTGLAYNVAGLDSDARGVVTFKDAANHTVTANVAANGAFTADLSSLSDGAVTSTLVITDTAGNSKTVAGAGFTLDTSADTGTAATLSISTTADGVINAAEKGALAFSVSGLDADARGVVTFKDAANHTVTANVAANGAFTADLSTLTDGAVTSSLVITDTAGNSKTVAGAGFTLDTSADTGTAAALSVSTTADGVINAAEKGALAFSVAGLDADAQGVVTFKDAANHTVTANVAANGAFTADLSSLTDGAVTSTMVITDTAGNSKTVAGAGFTLDTSADTGAAAALSVSTTADGVINAAEKGALAFSVAGLDADAQGVVTFKDAANHTVTANISANGAFTADLSTLSDGAVTSTLVITDTAGNSKTVAGAGFTLDAHAPVAPVISTTVEAQTNATSLSVGGTAEAGATVELFDGATSLGTVTAGSNGAWSKTLTLIDGHDYSLTAKATDAAGNTGPASNTLAFHDDQTAPTAPVITTTEAAQTNATSLAVTGTAEAGSTVELFDGSTSLGTVTAGSDGAWSKTLTLTDGHDYSLTAKATDAAGNTGPASNTLAFHDDQTAPTAPVITTTEEAQTNATTLAVSGTAEGGSTVELFDGSTSLGTVTAGSDGAWSKTLTLTDGHDYSLTAKATDAAGNTGPASNTLTFHDDQTAPAAPVITTTEDAQTNATSLAVTGTAEAGSTVELFDGSTSLGTVTVGSDGAWSKTLTLTDGHDYSLTAKATDAAGNTGPASNTLAFHDDQTAPAAPVITTTEDAQTNATSLVVSGTAEAGATVELFDGSTSLGTVTAGSDGAWSKTLSLTDGHDYSLTAKATDVAGNTGPASNTLSFHDDQTAPAAPVITTAADAQTNATSLAVTGTAEAGSTVELFDGSTSLGTVTAGSDGAWSKTLSLTDGHDYSLTAKATDAAGNTGPASNTLAFHDDQTAPAAPVITTTEDAETNATSLAVSGTAEAGSTVELFDGSTSLGTVTAGSDGAWSKTLSLTDGHDYSLTAKATDAAGNTGPASNTLAFHDDQTAPAAPVITTTEDAETNATSLAVSGTAEAGSKVELFDGATSLGTVTAGSDGAWSKTLTLSDGHDYSLTAKATDAAGNTGPASNTLAFHDDQTAPAAPVITTTEDAQTNAASLSVSGTAEAGSTVELFDGATSLGTVTAGSDGAWSKTLTLTDGHDYSLTAKATDAAGNTGPASNTLAFHDDQTAPAAPVITTTEDAETNATSLAVSGTAEAGSTVELFDGSTSLGTVTAGSDGAWSKTLTLTDGHDYSLTAKATDAAGNTGPASNTLAFHDDQTAPAAPVITTTEDAETNATTLAVSGTAEAGSTVELFDGSTSLGTVTAGSDGAWSKTLTLTDGHDYSLTAKATDAAGNTGSASNTLAFHDDQTAPAAPVITTTEDAQTNAASLSVSGTAEAGSTVELFDGSMSLGTVTAGSDGGWSKTLTLTDGHDYSLTAKATDAAGNTGSASNTLAFHDDQTAPAAPVITTSEDAETNATSLAVSGTAEAGSTVELFDGSMSLGTVTAGSDGGWSKTLTLTDGHDYSLTAKATDAAGNAGPASNTLTFHDDQTPPAAPVITTTEDAETNATSLAVSGTAEAGSTVELFDGATSLGTVTAASDGAWSKTLTLTDGHDYSLTAKATDAAGNTGPASNTLAFHDDQTAPAAPVITTTEDAETNATTLAVSGTAEAGSTVELFDGSTSLGTVTTGSDGAWSKTLTLTDGHDYSLTAKATDAASNTGPASNTLTFHDDQTPPAAPVITTTEDAETNATSLAVSGTAEAGSTVELFDGSTSLGTVTAGSDGAWSKTLSLADGHDYSLTAKATDAAGNTGPASNTLAFHDDQTAPAAPVITTTEDAETNATSLAVSGTAEAGSTVELFDGSTSLGTVTAGSDGAWSKTLSLTDGHDYSLTAKATDAAGNTGPASNTLAFHDDQTAPAAPVITTTEDAETNATTLAVSGTAEAGSTVELFDGSTSLGTVTTGSDGAWSKTLTLTDGHDYSLTAKATDAAGNTGPASNTLAFHDDQTAPAAPVITTTEDAETNATSLAVSGTAEAGSTVELFDGATSLGTVTAGSDGAWSKTLSLTDGHDYSLTAKATDAAGNTGPASNTLAFHDDQTAPAAPVITTTEDAQTNATSLTVSGTAEAGSTVELFDGSTSLGTVTAGSDGAWSKTLSLTDGHNYSLTAKATDAAGNTGSASNTLTFHDDQTAPAAPVITTTEDPQTNASTLAVSGTAEAGATVELFDGSTSLGTVTAGSDGAWSKTLTLTDGHDYSLTAKATDAAGNTGPASNILAFHDDQTAPAAPVITTTEDAQTNATTLAVSGTAEAGSTVELFDGANSLGTVTAGSDGAWSTTLTLTDGHDYSLTARATDAAGNTGPASNTLAFHDDQTAPAAPVITTTEDAQTNATSLAVSGTAEAGSTVELFDGAASLGTVTAGSDGAWSKTLTLTDGHDYSLTAKATDAAGNTGPASNTLAFHDDQTAPAAPVITTTEDAETNATTLAVSGTAEAGSTVELFDGNTSLGTVTAGSDGAWSKTLSLTDGHDYSLTAKATDAAGNTGPASNTLTFHDDQTPPAAPVITTTEDAETNATSLAVSGTAEAGSTVELFDGSTSLGTVTAGSDGAWSKALSLTDGHDYSLTAKATDAAGNTGPASNTLAFHDDQTAPAAPVIATTEDPQTNASALAVSGTAEAGSTVELFDGSTSLGTVTAGSDGAWSKTLSLTDGHDYSLTAKATDAAGNTGPASNTLAFHDDQTAPAAPVITTTEDAQTNATSLAVSGTAEAGSTVELFDGSTSLGTVTAGSDGAWSKTLTLTDGHDYSLTAKATDPAGNTGPASNPLAFHDDQTAPAAPVITTTGAAQTNATSLAVSGTAEAGSTVELFDGTTSLGTVTAASNGAWSKTLTLTDGHDYSLTAKATDAAGNTGQASNTLSFHDDQTAPAAPVITTTAAAQTNATSLAVSGTAEAGATVELFDGTTSLGAVTAASNGAWSKTLTLTDGHDYSLTAKATDAAGNTGQASNTLSFHDDQTAPAAPVITTTAAAQTNAASLAVTGTAEAGATVELFDGATSVGTVTAGANGAWSKTLSLTDGHDYSLTAKATDAAGNTGAASNALVFHDDRTAPTAMATVTALSADTGASASDFITRTAAQTVSGSYTGTLGAGETIQVSVDGTTWTTATASAGTWSASGVTLTGASSSLQVRTLDGAGNVTAGAGHSYTLDTTAPTAVATVTALSADTGASASDFITRTAAQTVSGSYTGTLGAGETIQVSLDGSSWTTASASGGTWSAAGVTLTSASSSLQVRTMDIAGNVTAGTGHSYTLDTTAPTAVATVTALSADTGSSATDFITRTAAQTVSGSYTGTLGAGETIQVSVDGSTWTTASASGGTWSAAGITLTGASSSLQVRTMDTAGNVTAGTGHSYTLDTTAPALAITAGSLTETATKVGSNTTLSVGFQGTSEAGASITVSGPGASNPAGGATWAFTSAGGQANGGEAYLVTATDAAGNSSATLRVQFGGTGNDTLTPTTGSDYFLAGQGDDSFVFTTANRGGADHIQDFETGTNGHHDTITLTGVFANYNAMLAATTDDAFGHAVINLGGGSTLTLDSVGKASLNSFDFVF